MAHSLQGKDREDFIITICDINIYLGCLCASTCEKNIVVEKYIWKRLNNYFKPQVVKFYDKKQGVWIENVKKLNSKDITNYLLACNVMGNMKAIKWYIYNHEVDKATILLLAKTMNEEQLVDLIYTLYRSTNNYKKIRGIGSTKSLFFYKNDKRIRNTLAGLWYKDKDSFVQLAYDTGWLNELGEKSKRGKKIYVDCLMGCSKLRVSLELIEEVLRNIENDENILDTFLKIILEEKGEKRQFAYLVYIQKIENGYMMTDKDYKLIRELGKPTEKIINYFIPFFIKVVNGAYGENIDLFEMGHAFSNVIIKPNKVSGRIGKTRNSNLEYAIKNSSRINLERVLFFYMKTTMSAKASLDELFGLLNKYHNVQINEFIMAMKKYPLWVKFVGRNRARFNEVTTEKHLEYDSRNGKGEVLLVTICDYDYITKHFHIEPYVGNLFSQ